MNQGEAWLSGELAKLYGFVRRARGCYLYTEKGVRLTDCFLDGGRALLGWDGGKARTAFKDTLERGATGSYDAGMTSRAVTAVKKLLPAEYSIIRFYSRERARLIDLKSAFSFAAKGAPVQLSKAVTVLPFLDITATTQPKVTGYDSVTVVHPETGAFASQPDVVRLVAPFPYAGAPDVYAFRASLFAGDSLSEAECADKASAAEKAARAALPDSDVMPSALLAAFARAFADLKLALGERTEAEFASFTRQLSPVFERKACYLYPKVTREAYPAFVLACLERGVVISPDYDQPSVVPYKANDGDLKKIAAAYTAVTEGTDAVR
ncbi:MAG: hypothetical protein KBT02_11040 [Treponema sp.]|nr:hypothetical protein [Candidatus Treponema caballi]